MRWCAQLAAGLALALGVWHAVQTSPAARREPRWAAGLAPLAQAPIPPGEAVALVVPVGLAEARWAPLLYEAAWQRPDLRWAALERWPGGPPPRFLVALPGSAVPPGFKPVSRAGPVVVLRRERP